MKDLLLKDVSLATVSLSADGTAVGMEFLSLQDGAPCAALQCRRVILLAFRNAFEHNKDAFPCYLGEVVREDLSSSSLRERLDGFQYGFSRGDGSTYMPAGSRGVHVHLEGGEVILDVICGEAVLVKGTSEVEQEE